MVDRIAHSAISSLLRAQTVGAATGIAALKDNHKAQQAIISALQESADQAKKQLAQTPKDAPPAGISLPRGSLVDILA